MISARGAFVLSAVLWVGTGSPIAGLADPLSTGGGVDGSTFGLTRTIDPLSQGVLERQALFGSRREALALQWQHRLSEEHSLALTAGYGEDPYLDEAVRDGAGTMASLAWTSQWGSRLRPQISGSLFAGDDSVKDELYRSLERRYYGLAVGGRLQLERHSPFLSFRMLRSEDAVDPLDPNSPEYSRLTAGWDWQIRRNWRFRAEADYTLYDTGLNLYRYDRAGVFFSTRFEFR